LYPIAANDPTPTVAQLATKPKGWYLALAGHEQVVTSALTVFGVTYFGTHQPAVPVLGSCSSNLGKASEYKVEYANAAGANRDEDGNLVRGALVKGTDVGLMGSPVAGEVKLDDGRIVPFVNLGIDPASPASPSSVTQPKSRVYWYLKR
jgi:type IV pilus assembly protein PilY1